MEHQPNILIFLTDQQSSQMMSCTGNPDLYTPALDKIANEGVRFTQAVCSNPVCVPSRFSLFTGHLPSKIGMRCNEDARNIPKVPTSILEKGMGFLLQKAGYKTYYGGKEHLPRFNSKDIGFNYICRDERSQLAKQSAEFLRKDHNQPFLLIVSLINPHDICYMAIDDFKPSKTFKDKVAKRRWSKRIEVRNVHNILKNQSSTPTDGSILPELPDNHQPQVEEPEAIKSLFKRPFRKNARENWNELKWKQHRYLYAKLTEMMDSEVGVVLEGLENGPHSENTVVIFTSDHGDHDGSHKLEHKTALYKEAVEIPFLIRWKGKIPEGIKENRMINNGLDLLPTVCDIAGIQPPEGLRGESILKLLKDDNSKKIKWTPVESEIGRALWSQDWAYVLYDEGIYREQLYDLKSDPGQTKNHLAAHQEVAEECRKIMQDIWKKEKDIFKNP